MDYRIEKKETFTVIGASKTFSYEGAKDIVPKFWQEHFKNGGGKTVMGVYGICIDEAMRIILLIILLLILAVLTDRLPKDL